MYCPATHVVMLRGNVFLSELPHLHLSRFSHAYFDVVDIITLITSYECPFRCTQMHSPADQQ